LIGLTALNLCKRLFILVNSVNPVQEINTGNELIGGKVAMQQMRIAETTVTVRSLFGRKCLKSARMPGLRLRNQFCVSSVNHLSGIGAGEASLAIGQ